jgi:hypothetical protein
MKQERESKALRPPFAPACAHYLCAGNPAPVRYQYRSIAHGLKSIYLFIYTNNAGPRGHGLELSVCEKSRAYMIPKPLKIASWAWDTHGCAHVKTEKGLLLPWDPGGDRSLDSSLLPSPPLCLCTSAAARAPALWGKNSDTPRLSSSTPPTPPRLPPTCQARPQPLRPY